MYRDEEVWCGAVVGMGLNMIWIDAPKWMNALVYTAIGWVVVVAFAELASHLGAAGTGLLVLGGVPYSADVAVVFCVLLRSG